MYHLYFAALDLHMISQVKIVIILAICESYACYLVVVMRIADDTFWRQCDGAAANSLAERSAATSVANKDFEYLLSLVSHD